MARKGSVVGRYLMHAVLWVSLVCGLIVLGSALFARMSVRTHLVAYRLEPPAGRSVPAQLREAAKLVRERLSALAPSCRAKAAAVSPAEPPPTMTRS